MPNMPTTPESLTKTFSRLVREVMTQSGFTQMDVARLAGVSQKNVSDIVNGEKSPSLRTVQKIGGAIGLRCELGKADDPPQGRPRAD